MPLHWQGVDPRERLRALRDGDVLTIGCPLAGIAEEPLTIHADLRLDADAQDALIVSHHGVSAGYALSVVDGRLAFALRDVPRPLRWQAFTPERHVVVADAALPRREVRVTARLSADGRCTLLVDDRQVGAGRLPGPLTHLPISTVSVGHWADPGEIGTDSAPARIAPAAFPGTLREVAIGFGP